MAEHNETGEWGEMLARQYLEKHDYAILQTHYRYGHAEADIIAYYEGVIVFVEVKTRQTADFGEPEEFVDRPKQRAYIRLANHYVVEKQRTEEVRFDIIAITLGSPEPQLRHLRDAFSTVGQRL